MTTTGEGGGSSGGGATGAVTTTAEVTGGPVEGTWRGFLHRSQAPEFALIFSDCASQQNWGVKMPIAVPEACLALRDHLYMEVSGVLHPPGEAQWQWQELEIGEFVVGPCREGSCEQGAVAATCGVWEELCGVYLECDPWVQDCPDGEKCMPYANNDEPVWDSTKCVPVSVFTSMGPRPSHHHSPPGSPCVTSGIMLASASGVQFLADG